MKVTFVIYGDMDQTSGGYLYDRKLKESLERTGVETGTVSIPRSKYLKNIWDNYRTELYEKLVNLETDILLQDELVHPSLFHLNKKLYKKVEYPILSIVHHLSYLAAREPYRVSLYKYFEKEYLKTINGFVFSSKATRNSVQSLIGETDGIVAYPGRDHVNPKATASTEYDGQLNLLFVGNLQPHKGLDVLINSLEDFKKFKLKIVGDEKSNPYYTEKIKKLIGDKGMENNVELTGFLTERELSKTFQESNLLIVPSFYEGFGIVYVEALGYGVPVIATQNGGAGEIIRDGREGFLLNPGDVEQLARYLRWFKQNPEYAERMSSMARRKYYQLPTWRESMEKAVEYLRDKAKNW